MKLFYRPSELDDAGLLTDQQRRREERRGGFPARIKLLSDGPNSAVGYAGAALVRWATGRGLKLIFDPSGNIVGVDQLQPAPAPAAEAEPAPRKRGRPRKVRPDATADRQ